MTNIPSKAQAVRERPSPRVQRLIAFAVLSVAAIAASFFVPGGGVVVALLGLLTPIRHRRRLAIALLVVGTLSSAVIVGAYWIDMHSPLRVSTTFGVGTSS